MSPCGAMSARSRTNRSPGFERGGSARSARGQPRRQLLRLVVVAVLPRRSRYLTLQSRRLRPRLAALVVVVAPSKLQVHRLRRRRRRPFPSSRRFPAQGSSTRRQKRKRRHWPRRTLLRLTPVSVKPSEPMLPQSRAPLSPQPLRRRVRHHMLQRCRRQRQHLSSPRHRSRLHRNPPAERPSVCVRAPWFRVRRVLVR